MKAGSFSLAAVVWHPCGVASLPRFEPARAFGGDRLPTRDLSPAAVRRLAASAADTGTHAPPSATWTVCPPRGTVCCRVTPAFASPWLRAALFFATCAPFLTVSDFFFPFVGGIAPRYKAKVQNSGIYIVSRTMCEWKIRRLRARSSKLNVPHSLPCPRGLNVA